MGIRIARSAVPFWPVISTGELGSLKAIRISLLPCWVRISRKYRALKPMTSSSPVSLTSTSSVAVQNPGLVTARGHLVVRWVLLALLDRRDEMVEQRARAGATSESETVAHVQVTDG